MNELVFWPILIALGAITIGATIKAIEALRAGKLADDECARLRRQLEVFNEPRNKSAIDHQPVEAVAVSQGRNHDQEATPPSDIFHSTLALIAKYHSQNDTATPKRIAADLSLDAEVTLAYMWKYHNQQFITFSNGGNKPDINTPFFLNPKAWQHIKVVRA